MNVSILIGDHYEYMKNALKKQYEVERTNCDILYASNEMELTEVLLHKNVDILICHLSILREGGRLFFQNLNKSHPNLLRIAIVAEDEQDIIPECLSYIHHFIDKSVDTSILKSYIDRIFKLRTLLGSSSMLELSTRINSLPSLPDIFYQVLNELTMKDPSIHKISELIEHDSSITSRIIQIVNSPALGVSHQVFNIEQSITLLGLDMTRTLVMYAGINSYLNMPVHILSTAESINKHSFVIGNLAQEITMLETGSYVLAQKAKMAGLLNNIGYMLLLNNPQTQIDIRKILTADKKTLLEAEQLLTGVTHAEIGAYFLGIRGFDEQVIEAIAYYYRPSIRLTNNFTPLTALHIAHVLAPSPLKSIIPCKKLDFDIPYLEKLGLVNRIEKWESLAQEVMQVEG